MDLRDDYLEQAACEHDKFRGTEQIDSQIILSKGLQQGQEKGH